MKEPQFKSRVESEEEFWALVDKRSSNECWPWKGFSNRGYGRVTYNGKIWKAHRLAWVFVNGPISSPSIYCCHKCDNPPCVNPEHIFLGTAKDNVDDAIRKGRLFKAQGQSHGKAKLTDSQVMYIKRMLRYGGKSGAIARVFGVDRTAIKKIKTGENWSHITTVYPVSIA